MTTKTMRRTQKDRSISTQRDVLEATLRCISRMGYAAMSLSEIAKEAGVSRGAITHHYATKLDLAAAATDHFFSARYERLTRRLAGNAALSLDERLDVLGAELEDLFPIGFEIIIALRNDPELQAKCNALAVDRAEEQARGYERMFPEFEKTQSPRDLIAVAASFYRGMFIEGFPTTHERRTHMADIFKAMLRNYLAQTPPNDGKPGGY